MDSAHIISAEVRVDGTIRGSGSLRVAGTVDGAIDLDGDLTIADGAQAEGSVTGRNVTVEGNVKGDVCAERTLVVSASGVVHGDVQAETLSIHPEASIKGHIAMRLDLPGGLNERGSSRSRR